jgi:AcrR family transcriptional regulator
MKPHANAVEPSDIGQEDATPVRKRRKAARPAELIEAGLAEFALRGFAGTRLEDVAKRAGVAKGTIYRYFNDKEALFLAAIESRAVPIHGQIDAFIDTFNGSTRDLLEMLVRTVYARLVDTDVKVLMRIIIAEGQTFPGLTEVYYREIISRVQALLARIVARGISRGEIRPGPVSDLPLVIMAPAMMAAVWKMTFNAHAPIATERFIAAHLDLLDRGLLS